MKNIRKIIAVVILFTSVAALIYGCGKGENVTKTTLYIEKNGKVTEAIVEAWDKDYYDEEEFKSQVDDAINNYVSENKDSKIQLKKFKIEDNEVKVNLKYDSIESYSQFNNVTAFLGTISEAQQNEYELAEEFVSTEGKPSITIDELDGSKDYYVVILSEKQEVSTGFKILYASKNVEVAKNKKTAVISDEDENSLAYLIYKK